MLSGCWELVFLVDVGDGGVGDTAMCTFHYITTGAQGCVGGPAKHSHWWRDLARSGDSGAFVPRNFAPLKTQQPPLP